MLPAGMMPGDSLPVVPVVPILSVLLVLPPAAADGEAPYGGTARATKTPFPPPGRSDARASTS